MHIKKSKGFKKEKRAIKRKLTASPLADIPKRKIQSVIAKMFDKRELIKNILEIQPIYFDQTELWWVWNDEEKIWINTDQTDILNTIHSIASVDTINKRQKDELIEALKQEARKTKPKDTPLEFIQFKGELVNINTGEKVISTPEYFTTNSIPHKLGTSNLSPTIDKLFSEWVSDDYKELLYEIIGYCFYRSYSLHRIFGFIGSGSNGKSSYLEILRRTLGNSNVSSTELEFLTHSRFESVKFHKKLACVMGETNFQAISKTSFIKRISSGDSVSIEYKGKTPFDDNPYAKLIIATNTLPETLDKTDGFYRRWINIDFPNRFSDKIDIISSITEQDYENLCCKALESLKNLISKREFTKEGTIEDKKTRYEEKSNPFEKFFKESIVEDFESEIPCWQFKDKINSWLLANRHRPYSDSDIGDRMKIKHIEQKILRRDVIIGEKDGKSVTESRTSRHWLNIKWKN